MLFLAELKEIPEKKSDIIKLLDVLFDAKKLHHNLLGKMESLGDFVEEFDRPQPKRRSSADFEYTAQK